MDNTRLSDEQENMHVENRTPGEVAQVEQMRKDAAAAAEEAATPKTMEKSKDEAKEKKVLDTPKEK